VTRAAGDLLNWLKFDNSKIYSWEHRLRSIKEDHAALEAKKTVIQNIPFEFALLLYIEALT